ncbi:MAG: histidine phosphatase family protein [Planctomycetia bacterium]|nr:histidine phosphatase family protein [Planctomycetia bacterium]
MSILPKFSSRNSMEYLEEQGIFRILIIRPGETLFDRQRHIQGNLNLHLTEVGQQEAIQLAEELNEENLNQIYTSPNISALETADRIANHLQIPRRILKGLRNQAHGLWEGMRVEEIQQHHPKIYRYGTNSPDAVHPPHGESLEDVKKRIHATIHWILKRHHSGTVGLVICEPLASIVQCYLKSEEAKNLWDYIGRHGLWEPVEIHTRIVA